MDRTPHPIEEHYLDLNRRRFFGRCARTMGAGLGTLALASLVREGLGDGGASASPLGEGGVRLAGPRFRPRAKRVIYLHMEGAPSQLDLFDYKPQLRARFDQDLPDSIRQGQRLTGMTSGQTRFPVAPSIFRFTRYANNQDGAWVSELMPHTGSVANELCFIRSMRTEAINHEPGITFFQTGNQQPGRPSFGSWVSYGLGSANANLPTFVVLITQGKGNMQALSARFWGSGFLPSDHQGCRLRSGGDPVLYLKDPAGVARVDRRRMLDLVGELNEQEALRTLDRSLRDEAPHQEKAAETAGMWW